MTGDFKKDLNGIHAGVARLVNLGVTTRFIVENTRPIANGDVIVVRRQPSETHVFIAQPHTLWHFVKSQLGLL